MPESAAREHPALDEFLQRVRKLRGRAELDAAAVEALDAFDAAGVRYLLLKGPALARLLYSAGSAGKHRGYSDVDLLVAPRHLPAARRALSDLGYTNLTAGWGVEDIAGAVHADDWVRRNQQIGPLVIDLHSRLPGVQAPSDFAWEALEARRIWIDLDGRPAAVLGRDGLALHMATHAAQHGPRDIKTLGDLAYGLERWPRDVWREAAGLAARVQATRAFAGGLRLVPAGAALASELGLPATDDLEWEIRHEETRPRGTFHLQAFMEARSLTERARMLRRSLLPKREWIVWQDPRAANSRTRLLTARVRHLVRTPGWAVKAWRFRRQAQRGAPR